jgi:CheY-like chemotaxis protein
VRVYLPRAGEAPAPAAAPPAARAGGAGTILLVEDDVLVRRVAERTLDGLGYRVLAAASGEEALARAAEAQEIDLLVSDVVMPGLCGAELARRLRATRPGTRVLFISGYPGGANGPPPDLSAGRVLRKPFTPEELAEEVRRTLA